MTIASRDGRLGYFWAPITSADGAPSSTKDLLYPQHICNTHGALSNIFAIPLAPYPTYLQCPLCLTQHICKTIGALPNIFATPLVPYPTYLQHPWFLTQHICNTAGASPNIFAIQLAPYPTHLQCPWVPYPTHYFILRIILFFIIK